MANGFSLSRFYKESAWQNWFLTTYILIGALFLLLNASDVNNVGNTTGAVSIAIAALVFLLFAVVGLLAQLYNVTGLAKPIVVPISQGKNASLYAGLGMLIAFILGFFVFGGLKASVYNPELSVFGTAAAALPAFWNTWLLTVAAPIGEELAFLIGIPTFLAYVWSTMGNTALFSFLRDPKHKILSLIITTALTIIITSYLFAYFHRSVLPAFFVAALLFRAFILTMVEIDKSNYIHYLAATFTFAVGAHMINNINATVGLAKWFATMGQNVFGVVILAFLLINVLVVVYELQTIGNIKRIMSILRQG